MSRPSFQFYHGDWISNAKLRRCTHDEKGVWIDVLCLMADSDEFGIVRWPLQDLAQAVGAKLAVLKSLVRKGVLKGADEGETCEAYIYVPRSGRKNGDPVALIQAQQGPIWFSSKQVRDEYVRATKGASTRFGATPDSTPNRRQGESPNTSPNRRQGEGKGDGSPSPSPSPTPVNTKPIPTTSGADAPPPDPIFGIGLDFLRSKGVEERAARSFLGLMRNAHSDGLVFEVIEEAKRLDITQPIPWIRKACETRKANGSRPSKRAQEPDFAKLNYREGVSDDGRF